MRAKFSNTTSVGKYLNFNQERGRVALLPSLFFSYYAALLLLASNQRVVKHNIMCVSHLRVMPPGVFPVIA